MLTSLTKEDKLKQLLCISDSFDQVTHQKKIHNSCLSLSSKMGSWKQCYLLQSSPEDIMGDW